MSSNEKNLIRQGNKKHGFKNVDVYTYEEKKVKKEYERMKKLI